MADENLEALKRSMNTCIRCWEQLVTEKSKIDDAIWKLQVELEKGVSEPRRGEIADQLNQWRSKLRQLGPRIQVAYEDEEKTVQMVADYASK